jgi:hypothetical protein
MTILVRTLPNGVSRCVSKVPLSIRPSLHTLPVESPSTSMPWCTAPEASPTVLALCRKSRRAPPHRA